MKPEKNFEVVPGGSRKLRALDEAEDIRKGVLKGFSSGAEPFVDRAFQHFDANEEAADRLYMRIPSSGLNHFIKGAVADRITARERIREDIGRFNNTFPHLSLPEQCEEVALLQKRQADLAHNGLQKYQASYVETEKKLTTDLTKNMIDEIVKMKAESSGNSALLIKLENAAENILSQTHSNHIELSELRESFGLFTREFMQFQIDNHYDIQLTQEQIVKMEQRLIEFDYKYDQDRAERDIEYKATHAMLSKIIQAEENRKRIEEKQKIADHSEQVLMAVNGSFCAIQQLGNLMQNDALSKVGQLGQIGVNIVKNVSLLTGSFGFAAVGGLAMLGPISAIAISGIALFSLFGKSGPSEMEMLSRQIQDFRRSMERYLGRVVDNQQLIYKEITDLYRFVAHDLRMPINYKLDSMFNTMSKFNTEHCLRDLDREQQSLRDDIISVESLSHWATQEGRNVFEKSKAFDYEGRLADWITHGAKRSTFVGIVDNNATVENWLIDIATKISYQSTHLLTLPLATLASHIDPEFPVNIKLHDLVNINMYSLALESYNELLRSKNQYEAYNYETLSKARYLLNNFNLFTDYLKHASTVYLFLIKTYQQCFAEIHTLFQEQFKQDKDRISEGKSETFLIKGILGSLLSNDMPNGLKLRNTLKVMDACRTLLCAYCSFSGIPANRFLAETPYSSADILNHNVDWSSQHNDALKTDNRVLFRTVAAKTGESESVFLITRNKDSVTLKQYCKNDNTWLDKPGFNITNLVKTDYTFLRGCFLAKRLTHNTKDTIYLVYQDGPKLKMSYYDVENLEWHHNIDAPVISNSSLNHELHSTTMKMLSFNSVDQGHLYFLMCDKDCVKLQSFDFSLQHWQQLPDGPAWSNSPDFYRSGQYKTFDVLPIENHFSQHKIAIVMKSGNTIRLATYDTEKHWNADYAANSELTTLLTCKPKVKAKKKKAFPLKNLAVLAQQKSLPYPEVTVRYAAISIANNEYISFVLRTENGVVIMAYHLDKNNWEKWDDATDKNYSGPDWSNTAGFGTEQCFHSMRITNICLSGQYHLVCGIRKEQLFECYAFNPAAKTWFPMLEKPQWSNVLLNLAANNALQSHNLASITLLPVITNNQHAQLAIIAKTRSGIDFWQCQLKTPNNIMATKTRDSGSLIKLGVFRAQSSQLIPEQATCDSNTDVKTNELN